MKKDERTAHIIPSRVVRRNRARQWQVIFYTKSDLGQSRIVRHRDTFTDGYAFDSEEVEIALGRGGYVF